MFRNNKELYSNAKKIHNLHFLEQKHMETGQITAVAKKGNTGATVGNDRCHWARTSALPGV